MVAGTNLQVSILRNVFIVYTSYEPRGRFTPSWARTINTLTPYIEALWLLTATGKMAYPQLLTSQPATGPASDVSLTVSCRKLAKSDVLSKSDPMAVVYQLAGDGSWAEVLT